MANKSKREWYDLSAYARPSGVYLVRSGEVFDGEVAVKATSEDEAIEKVIARLESARQSGIPLWRFDIAGLED